jgi:AIPR protein
VPAAELAQLHDTHGERLFERNVRLFLGARPGSVNAAIAETLGDGKERGNFWAYNNGITIICSSVDAHDGYVKVKDFSIVNGCQTTVSIGLAGKQLDNVAVLVRFIAASSRIVDDVIRYTNSQNAIRTWDIASQDKTQRRLKKEFGKLQKPYIYLTRRGDRPTGELKKFRDDGRLRQIRIDVAGQFAAAFRGEPVLAYKHKAFIFSESHDEVFPPDVRVEEVLFQCVCGDVCKDVVARAIAKGNPDDTEVRILNKGGVLFVLATLARIALARNRPTYLKSITEERASSNTARQRLRKYAEYATNSYVQAVSDLAEMKKEELSTLIRQREFWDKVIERACRSFQKESIAKKWLDEALPKLF